MSSCIIAERRSDERGGAGYTAFANDNAGDPSLCSYGDGRSNEGTAAHFRLFVGGCYRLYKAITNKEDSCTHEDTGNFTK